MLRVVMASKLISWLQLGADGVPTLCPPVISAPQPGVVHVWSGQFLCRQSDDSERK